MNNSMWKVVNTIQQEKYVAKNLNFVEVDLKKKNTKFAFIRKMVKILSENLNSLNILISYYQFSFVLI